MHPDVHVVRTRPPILDVPPLVWIDQPGTARTHLQNPPPFWEWPSPAPPRRFPLLFLSPVVGAIMGALAFALAYQPDPPAMTAVPAAPRALPVPDEPIYWDRNELFALRVVLTLWGARVNPAEPASVAAVGRGGQPWR
jgi:hypothetical protein